MGSSRDPMNYDEEERALMLAACGETIRLEFDDKKDAYNQRGRLYGLRKAAQVGYDRLQVLLKQKKPTIGYDNEFIRAAPALRTIGIRYGNDEHTVLVMGRGEALEPKRRSALSAAVRKYNIISEEKREEAQAIAAMGRLGDEVTGKGVDTTAGGDVTIKGTGYSLEEITGGDTPSSSGELSDEALIAKMDAGGVATPAEMKRLKEMKQ